jgi:hypothetical protein
MIAEWLSGQDTDAKAKSSFGIGVPDRYTILAGHLRRSIEISSSFGGGFRARLATVIIS